MGMKDNFTQAFNELVGINKKKPEPPHRPAPQPVRQNTSAPQANRRAEESRIRAGEEEEVNVTVSDIAEEANASEFDEVFDAAFAQAMQEEQQPQVQQEEAEALPVTEPEQPVVEAQAQIKSDDIYEVDKIELEINYGDDTEQDSNGDGGEDSGEEAVAQPEDGLQTTTIAKGTSIIGTVSSAGHVNMLGNIKGDIDAVGNVKVCGKMVGDVRGESVELSSCAVMGNVLANASVVIDEKSVIVGDIEAEDMLIGGKMKGNARLNHGATFQNSALLVGNVNAKVLAIDEGAELQGEVRVVNKGVSATKAFDDVSVM